MCAYLCIMRGKKSLKDHKINCVQWLFGGVKLRYWSSEVGERLTYILMEF